MKYAQLYMCFLFMLLSYMIEKAPDLLNNPKTSIDYLEISYRRPKPPSLFQVYILRLMNITSFEFSRLTVKLTP